MKTATKLEIIEAYLYKKYCIHINFCTFGITKFYPYG